MHTYAHICCCLVTHVWPFCSPMDWGPPGASVHGILQARILEWVAISYSRGSSQPRELLHCRGVLYHWATHTYTTHILEAPGLAHKRRLPSLGSRATCPVLWEPAWIKTRGSKSRTGGPAGGVGCTPPRMSPRRAGCPWIRSPRLLSAPQCRNRAHPRMWWSSLYAHVQQWQWLYGSFVARRRGAACRLSETGTQNQSLDYSLTEETDFPFNNETSSILTRCLQKPSAHHCWVSQRTWVSEPGCSVVSHTLMLWVGASACDATLAALAGKPGKSGQGWDLSGPLSLQEHVRGPLINLPEGTVL